MGNQNIDEFGGSVISTVEKIANESLWNYPSVNESIDDVNQSVFKYLKSNPSYWITFLGIFLVLEILLFVLGADEPVVFLYPLIIPFLGVADLMNRIKHEFMKQFASANGFSYEAGRSIQGLDGSLFSFGKGLAITDIVSGSFMGRFTELFSYDAVPRSPLMVFSVFIIKLEDKLPYIFLKSKTMDVDTANWPAAKREKLQLEGDFNQFFNVFVQEGCEIEALEVFTPDIMQILIDDYKEISFEVVGSSLYIYVRKTIGNKSDLYKMYDIARFFIEKINPKLSEIKLSAGF
jgi:hypothetical protein